MVTKINPIYKFGTARSFLGKSLTAIDFDFNVDVDASLDPGEAVDSIIKSLSLVATVAMVSEITGTGQLMTVFFEGKFPTDKYDGTNSETFAAYMQTVIRALGTVDSLSFTSATATAGVVYLADQV
jgi:hypothetical protein